MINGNKQTEKISPKQDILGWLIALQGVINGFLQSMFPQFMSVRAVIWISIIFFILICFWDRNLLKTQDGWQKEKIAWGWCLFTPVYLYKRARILKENLLKFWICLISFIFTMIYSFNIVFNTVSPIAQNKIYKNCIYELSQHNINDKKTDDVCWAEQTIFNKCTVNLRKSGYNNNPKSVMDICNEVVSELNICAQTITKESESTISIDIAFEICVCSKQYDINYCTQKYIIPNCKKNMQQNGLDEQTSEEFCLCMLENDEEFCLEKLNIQYTE
ncbi:MAG: hypothetical protein MJ170_03990 [Alphaproteobacteria bacterium]|nr:hypothetical protein [Alphaproteobacteria bacterium]